MEVTVSRITNFIIWYSLLYILSREMKGIKDMIILQHLIYWRICKNFLHHEHCQATYTQRPWNTLWSHILPGHLKNKTAAKPVFRVLDCLFNWNVSSINTPNFASNSPALTLISSLFFGTKINCGAIYFNIASHTSEIITETV